MGIFKYVNKCGTRGYEIEFKGTQTLYENEILCTIEPHDLMLVQNQLQQKKA